MRKGRNEVKISTRNRLPGRITEVVKGEAVAKVGLQVGDDHLVSLITREGAEELGLEAGKEVIALIKATDILILTTTARFCILIQGVDNPDQAPLHPAPVPPFRARYSRC